MAIKKIKFKVSPSDEEQMAQVIPLPFLGKVAGGLPLEEKNFNDFVSVPLELVKEPETSFVLRVNGNSMKDAGILEGDLLIVQSTFDLNNGDVVVASTQEEASTVKYFYKNEFEIELRPANANYKPLYFKEHEITIKGKVVGLIRRYQP